VSCEGGAPRGVALPSRDGGYDIDERRLTDRRIQKASKLEGETAFSRLVTVTTDLFKNEGPAALYKGITPRVLRVAPGQAIVFTVSPYHRMCGEADG
jgi:hypothetical protein